MRGPVARTARTSADGRCRPNALVPPSAVAALVPSILLLHAALCRSLQSNHT